LYGFSNKFSQLKRGNYRYKWSFHFNTLFFSMILKQSEKLFWNPALKAQFLYIKNIQFYSVYHIDVSFDLPLKPLTWAKPVIPGFTQCRTIYFLSCSHILCFGTRDAGEDQLLTFHQGVHLKLRHFINTCLPNKLAYSSDTWIVLRSLHFRCFINFHRTKFITKNSFSMPGLPCLKNWPSWLQFD
jgi:hypothetical protein